MLGSVLQRATVQINVVTVRMHVLLQRSSSTYSNPVVRGLGRRRAAKRPCNIYQVTREKHGGRGVPSRRMPAGLGSQVGARERKVLGRIHIKDATCRTQARVGTA